MCLNTFGIYTSMCICIMYFYSSQHPKPLISAFLLIHMGSDSLDLYCLTSRLHTHILYLIGL